MVNYDKPDEDVASPKPLSWQTGKGQQSGSFTTTLVVSEEVLR